MGLTDVGAVALSCGAPWCAPKGCQNCLGRAERAESETDEINVILIALNLSLYIKLYLYFAAPAFHFLCFAARVTELMCFPDLLTSLTSRLNQLYCRLTLS